MSKPLAICIETVGGRAQESQYMRCVALPGRQSGLGLDGTGTILWQTAEGVACELWVSADEQLILYRPAGAVQVTVHRSGRSLDVPHDKPVVILDKDDVDVGEARLRIHVHGEAHSVAPPSVFVPDTTSLGTIAKAAATAAALLGALSTTGCSDANGWNPLRSKNIPVRTSPPKIEPPPDMRRDPPPEPPPGDTQGTPPPTSPEGQNS